MSSIPPPNSVANCGCQHKEPQNLTCPYALPNTCGGPTYCGYCRANNPPVQPIPPPTPVQPLTLDDELPEYRTPSVPKPLEGDAYGAFYGQPITDE